MTAAAEARRRSDLALIHQAAQQLGLLQRDGDGDYRLMLRNIGGADSAADLTAAGRAKILQHLRSLGWRPAAARRNPRPAWQRKIWAQWYSLAAAGQVDSTEKRILDAWIHRQSGVHRLEQLDSKQARFIIEALKDWQSRIGAPNANRSSARR